MFTAVILSYQILSPFWFGEYQLGLFFFGYVAWFDLHVNLFITHSDCHQFLPQTECTQNARLLRNTNDMRLVRNAQTVFNRLLGALGHLILNSCNYAIVIGEWPSNYIKLHMNIHKPLLDCDSALPDVLNHSNSDLGDYNQLNLHYHQCPNGDHHSHHVTWMNCGLENVL